MPYLDTSVVVGYYVYQPVSGRAQAIYSASSPLAISELVEVEFFSALSLRIRTSSLDRGDAERVAELFLSHLEAGWYERIHLHAGHYFAARRFIARFDLPLKAPDALHLGVSAVDGLPLVTADQQLARNAEALGLEVELLVPS